MTQKQVEFWHTWRGPLTSVATSIALAIFWWAVNYKALQVKIDYRISAVEAAEKETKADLKDHKERQIVQDKSYTADIAEIKEGIRDIRRNQRNRQ